MPVIIGIEKGHEFPFGMLQRLVAGGVGPLVGLLQKPDVGIFFSQFRYPFCAAVGGTIVNDDELEVRPGLLNYAFNSFLQVFFCIEAGPPLSG